MSKHKFTPHIIVSQLTQGYGGRLVKGRKSIKAALIHPPDINGRTSLKSIQSAIIALRAVGKIRWDYKQKMQKNWLIKKLRVNSEKGEFPFNKM